MEKTNRILIILILFGVMIFSTPSIVLAIIPPNPAECCECNTLINEEGICEDLFECVGDGNGDGTDDLCDWVINETNCPGGICTLGTGSETEATTYVAPGNVIVKDGYTLTIPELVTLDVNLTINKIIVENGGNIEFETSANRGRIFHNNILTHILSYDSFHDGDPYIIPAMPPVTLTPRYPSNAFMFNFGKAFGLYARPIYECDPDSENCAIPLVDSSLDSTIFPAGLSSIDFTASYALQDRGNVYSFNDGTTYDEIYGMKYFDGIAHGLGDSLKADCNMNTLYSSIANNELITGGGLDLDIQFANCITQVELAKALAEQKGYEYECRALSFITGSSASLFSDPNMYQSINNGIKESTGANSDINVFLLGYGGGDSPTELKLQTDDNNIYIMAPLYTIKQSRDTHGSHEGYFILGEYMAKAVKAVHNNGSWDGAWEPLRPKSITWDGVNYYIDIKYQVSNPPLILDADHDRLSNPGNFGFELYHPGVENTNALGLADFNGDNQPDLIESNVDRPITISPWNSTNGYFDSSAELQGGYGQYYDSIAIGDVDKDGDLDIYTAGDQEILNDEKLTKGLYINKGDDGSGNWLGFEDPVCLVPYTYNFRSVVFEDVNKDTYPDLIVGEYGKANLIYLNNGDDGSGNWDGFSANAIYLDSVSGATATFEDLMTINTLDILGEDFNGVEVEIIDDGSISGNDASVDIIYEDEKNNIYKKVSIKINLNVTTAGKVKETLEAFDIIWAGDHADKLNIFPSVVLSVDATTELTSELDAAFVGGINEGYNTRSLVAGLINDDGFIDIIAGNLGQPNRIYINKGNDGLGDWLGFEGGVDIDTTKSYMTMSLSLGNVDGDTSGNLDLVVGNYNQPDRLYIGNGAGGFDTGRDVSDEENKTRSVILHDVDDSGGLDIITGNEAEFNRLYLNNGTADPFNGVVGSNFGNENNRTQSLAIGTFDSNTYIVEGNYAQPNRLYEISGGTIQASTGLRGTDSAPVITNVEVLTPDNDIVRITLDKAPTDFDNANIRYAYSAIGIWYHYITASYFTRDITRTAWASSLCGFNKLTFDNHQARGCLHDSDPSKSILQKHKAATGILSSKDNVLNLDIEALDELGYKGNLTIIVQDNNVIPRTTGGALGSWDPDSNKYTIEIEDGVTTGLRIMAEIYKLNRIVGCYGATNAPWIIPDSGSSTVTLNDGQDLPEKQELYNWGLSFEYSLCPSGETYCVECDTCITGTCPDDCPPE